MENCKVTVVIPVYNVERYVGRCIESVIRQTYKNIEILLLNDGSDDGSDGICREYASRDKRVKYYYHDNMGLARTRNRGIRIATGEYITFLDSDDWLEPDFIGGLMADMQDNHADIGVCDLDYMDDITGNSHIVKLRFFHSSLSIENDKSVVNKSRLFACGKIYRLKLFKDYNVEFPDFAYEDICTPMLIIHSKSVSYTQKSLYHYVVNRSGSLSNTPENIQDMGKGLIWLKERLVKEDLYERFSIEFKKIALAQLRFAVRRFNGMADRKTQDSLCELLHIVEELLPDLQGIAERKYYVSADSPILRAVLDKCLPYENQIVSSNDEADSRLMIDETQLTYNLAEQLMEII